MKAVNNHNMPTDGERRRQAAVSTWVATGMTFVVILGLWALLIPTMFAGLAAPATPAWLTTKNEAAGATTFEEALDRSHSALDRFEKTSIDSVVRERAGTEAAGLRERLEGKPAVVNAPESKPESKPQ
jgi:hypothetical protein